MDQEVAKCEANAKLYESVEVCELPQDLTVRVLVIRAILDSLNSVH